MTTIANEPGTEHDNHERCQCGKPEQGYALRGKDGKFHPSCWPCVRPKNPPKPAEPKEKIVYVPEKDLDLQEKSDAGLPSKNTRTARA